MLEDELLANVRYAEEQVNRLVQFHFDSFDLLTKEALTTINWLFGLIIGSSGYLLSATGPHEWWLAWPLGGVCLFSAVEAWLLIQDALLAKDVPSIGNEPSNIANDDVLNQSEANLRLGQVRETQRCINQVRDLITVKAEAVNRARRAIIIIPSTAVVLATVLYSTKFLPDDLLSVCHP